jgi:hypothetical protein
MMIKGRVEAFSDGVFAVIITKRCSGPEQLQN